MNAVVKLLPCARQNGAQAAMQVVKQRAAGALLPTSFSKPALRTLTSRPSGRVLRYRVSQEAAHQFGGVTNRRGWMAGRVQSDNHAALCM